MFNWDPISVFPLVRTSNQVRARWLVGVGIVLVSACASTTYTDRSSEDRRVSGAFQQPFRDVSWMRENPPDILIRAVEAPYALEPDAECGPLLEEITALDAVLGPDLDAENPPEERSSTDALGLVAGAIRGAISLPYRSIIRRLSGAEERDHVLRDAIFAGMVRRAFLRGVAQRADCATNPASHQVQEAGAQEADAQAAETQEADALVAEPQKPPPEAQDTEEATAEETAAPPQ